MKEGNKKWSDRKKKGGLFMYTVNDKYKSFATLITIDYTVCVIQYNPYFNSVYKQVKYKYSCNID